MNLESTAYKSHFLAAVAIYLVICVSVGGLTDKQTAGPEALNNLQASSGGVAALFDTFLVSTFTATAEELKPYVRYVASHLVTAPVFSMDAVDRKAAQVVFSQEGHSL